jgi:glycine cleavage system pyridoxal-binding protein P
VSVHCGLWAVAAEADMAVAALAGMAAVRASLMNGTAADATTTTRRADHSGEANGVSVTIKGGVKLTTLEILDTNLKSEEWTGEYQVGEYQKFGNMAGMKGDHVFGLVLHRVSVPCGRWRSA